MTGEIITTIEKRDHIFLVERFIADIRKVGWNARKVKFYPVTFGNRIDPVEVADALILYKRGN